MRGLASLMVFFAHIIIGYDLHIYKLISQEDFIGVTLQKFYNVGVFGVEIFFFLSGFVIYRSAKSEDEKDFFKRRFFRVYPLYFLFTCIFIFGNYLFEIEPSFNNIEQILASLLFLNLFVDLPSLTPNSWSVVFEVWYYFGLFYLVRLLDTKYTTNWKSILGVVLLFWMLVKYPITIYFLLGVVLSKRTCDIELQLQRISSSLLNVITAIIFIFLLYIISDAYKFAKGGWLSLTNSSFGVLIPILLFSFMAMLMDKRNFISRLLGSRALTFYGTISYSLYLLHPYVYFATKKVFGPILINSNMLGLLTFIAINFALSSLFSVLINRLFEMPIYGKMSNKNLYQN